MKLEKIKSVDYNIVLPKGGPKYPPTEPDFFSLPICMLCVAKPRSGKTCSIAHFLKLMKKNNCLDRLILVSGTYHNNKHYFTGLPLDDETDVIEPRKDAPEIISDKLDQEAQEYEEFLAKSKRYNYLMGLINNRRKSIEDIPDDLLLEFEKLEKPKWKYSHLNRPAVSVVLDDCEGTSLMKASSKLSNMVIKFRHLGKFESMDGALGCNLIFCTQNYKSSSGGLLKGIRNCVTQICIWKTKNEKELMAVAEEAAGEVSIDDFMECYQQAIQDRHDFLCIDFNKKPNHPSMFRRNFSEFIVPN